jgi:hypothetical protein
MKRIKIFKAYFILWLFVYFIAVSNLETFKLYFLSTLTFNIAIVSILAIGTFMILKGSKDLVMLAGIFGILMYKRGNLSKYIKGIEKIFPSNIAIKIKHRVENGSLMFTQQEKEEILVWIGEKFANQNKYNNFFIGTVLMIGLLGTFAGLLGAIGSMGDIVMSLAGSDVEIGKIMAGFSGPLSSMAVGFGSSLFGVISAILLSIKGYLLNKAQESLQEGAENWLNSKTLDSMVDENSSASMTPTNTLEAHQPSFIDVFIEKISMLTNEINTLSTNNQVQQEQFTTAISKLENQYIKQQNSLLKMQESLVEVSTQTTKSSNVAEKSLEFFQKANSKQSDYLKQLIDIQESQQESSSHFSDRIEKLTNATKESSEQLSRKDKALFDLVIKQEERAQSENIGMFNVVDAIESMHKNIDKKIGNLQPAVAKNSKKSDATQNKSFLKEHLNTKTSEKV